MSFSLLFSHTPRASGATEDEDLPLSVRFNTYSAAQIMLQLMAFNPSPPGVSPPLPTDVDMEDSVEWITTPGFEMANDQTGLSFSTVGYNSDMFFLLDISSNAVRSFAHTSAPLNTIYIPNKKAKMSSICAAKDCLFVLCENPSCLFIVDTKGDWDYFRLADRGITNPKAFACSPDAKFFSVYCADSRSIFRFDTVTCKLLDKICVAKYNLHIKHLRIDHNGNYAVKDSDSWAFVIFDRLSGECTDSFNIHYQSEGNINYPYHFRDCAFLPDGKIVLCYEEINALAITSCEHKGRIISFLGEGRTYNSVSCNSEGTLLAASECSNSYLSFRNAHKLPANPSCDIAPLILF